MSAPRHPIGFVGRIATEGWAGRTHWPVEVIGYTPRRYRVRILPCLQPGGTVGCQCAGENTAHAGALPSFYVQPGSEVVVPLRVVWALPADAGLRQEAAR